MADEINELGTLSVAVLQHSKTGERIVAIGGELMQGQLSLRIHADRYEYSFDGQEFKAVSWPDGAVIITALLMRELPIEPIQILLNDISERFNSK